jgi:hypothetical protein
MAMFQQRAQMSIRGVFDEEVRRKPLARLRGADTTSYVADYLTRSVRRPSGFVLADCSVI